MIVADNALLSALLSGGQAAKDASLQLARALVYGFLQSERFVADEVAQGVILKVSFRLYQNFGQAASDNVPTGAVTASPEATAGFALTESEEKTLRSVATRLTVTVPLVNQWGMGSMKQTASYWWEAGDRLAATD